MDGEHPILRSLLDSLNAMNQRLNIIENVLSVPADPAQPTAAPQSSGGGQGHPHVLPQPRTTPAHANSSRGPLPAITTLPQPSPHGAPHYAATTSSSSSLPSPASFHKPPTSASIPPYSPYDYEPARPSPTFAQAPKRSAPPLQTPNTRLKVEDDNSDEDIEGKDSQLAGRDAKGRLGKDDDDEDDDEDGEEDISGEAGSGRGAGDGDNGEGSSSLPKELQPTGVSNSRLEALPEGFVVSGRATLQEELDGWTIPRGYSMRINGTRSHGRRQKIRMVCFRGGRSRLRPKEEEAKRERERERLELFPDLPPRRRKPTTDRISKKCECPFRFELVEVCPGADRYAVHYTNDDHTQHNHAAADLMLDPRARKLPRALKAEVDQWLRDASTLGGNGKSSDASNTGWTIAKIQAELQRRGYGHVLDFDLRNRKRALLHKDRMAQLKTDGTRGGEGAGESRTGGDTPTSVS
ncbi:hypothetical protein SEUCBS139899_006992 [Sporothrix eucalyptigena]|uniref:Transcription factor n=1 Tax=Sporothrix eucalyptigena TaxID=1812306 RepID=A0ABP0C324_9PEZI